MLYLRELARDLFESAELLYRNLKYRDSAPLLRRAVEESAKAAAMAAGRENPTVEEALEALAQEADLAALGRGIEVPALLDRLAEIAEETSRDPLALYPSTRTHYRQLFDQAAVFVHRSGRLVRGAARTERDRHRSQVLLRLAGALSGVAALGIVLWVFVGWVRDHGTGLRGEYFADPALEEPAARRVDRQIDFTWPPDSLPRGVSQQRFSVRWTGQVEAPEAGTYRFTVRSDDGARLWVADRLLVDAWVLQAVTEHSGTIDLEAGWHPIRLEYFQDGGGAMCRLDWQLPDAVAASTIPAGRLRPK